MVLGLELENSPWEAEKSEKKLPHKIRGQPSTRSSIGKPTVKIVR